MFSNPNLPFNSKENVIAFYSYVTNLLAVILHSLRWLEGTRLKNLVDEIDIIVSERFQGNIDNNDFLENLSPADSVSTAQTRRIIHLLSNLERERLNFVRNFPLWQKFRDRIIEKMLETASRLEDDFERNKNDNKFARFFGISAVTLPCVFTGVFVAPAVLVFSLLNCIIRTVTSITEEQILQRYYGLTNELIESDRNKFEEMLPWFNYNVEFISHAEFAIGTDVCKYIMKKLKSCYDHEVVERFQEIDQDSQQHLRNCFSQLYEILSTDYPHLPRKTKIKIAEYCLKFFIVLSHPALGIQWSTVSSFISKVKNYGAAALFSCSALSNLVEPPTAIVNLFDLKSLTIGSFGTIMNVVPVVLDIWNDGRPCEPVNKIKDTATKLQRELGIIEQVYLTVKYSSVDDNTSGFYKMGTICSKLAILLLIILFLYLICEIPVNLWYFILGGFATYATRNISIQLF